MKKLADIIVLAVMAVIAAVFIWWLDLAWGGGVPWWFYAVYVGLCSLFLVPLVVWRFKRIKMALYAAFVLSTVVLAMVPLTPRDYFLRRFHNVKPGMATAQVDSVLQQYANRRWDDKIIGHENWLPEEFKNADEMVTFRHSADAAFNADEGEVYFRNGRVLGTRFLPD